MFACTRMVSVDTSEDTRSSGASSTTGRSLAGPEPRGGVERLLQTRRASLILVAVVFATTVVQVLAPPILGFIQGAEQWPLPLPPVVALTLLVMGCAAQAAALLLSERWPKTSVFATTAVYLALVVGLSVPNWLVGMYLVVAVAQFLLATRASVAASLACLIGTGLLGMGGLFVWLVSVGTDPGYALGFVSAEIAGFVAPTLGATALGAWWSAQVRRVALVREQAEIAKEDHDRRVLEARERERTRIGQELHDVAGQHLAGLITLADAAMALAPQRPADALQLVEDVRNEGRFAAASLAGALSDLRANATASVETTRDLRRASELVDYWAERGMRVRLDLRGTYSDLPAVVSTSVYRALQEALTNAAKHAPGSDVAVALAASSGSVDLTVVNTAAATSAQPLPGLDLGWGLNGMRERIGLLRGTLTAGQTDEGGWQVSLRVPLDTSSDS